MSSLNCSVPASSSRERQYSFARIFGGLPPSNFAVSVSLLIDTLLTMTCRTTRQFFDVILFHELQTQGEPIGRCLVLHAEHVLARTDKSLRRSVTLQTPIHIKRVLTPHQRHLVDPAVAGYATNSLVHVNAVIEVNESGKVVHPRPLDRLSST